MKFPAAAMALIVLCCPSVGRAASDNEIACHLGRNKPDASIPACTLLIAQSKDARTKANAFYNRGIALARQNDLKHALDDLNQAVTLNPRWAFVYEDRAEVKEALGDYRDAIPDYSMAIRLDPGHAFRFQGRGRSYERLNDLDAAIADFNTAISIDARDFRFFDRGVALMKKGEFEKAIVDFDETIRRNPNHAEAFAKRGLALLETGQLDRASIEVNRAVTIDPKDSSNYTDRARVLERSGDLAKALADLNASLVIRPGDQETVAARDRVKAAMAAQAASLRKTPEPVVVQQSAPAPPPVNAPSPRTAVRRVALVIGNGLYPQVGRLRNTVEDARAVAQMFEREGFDVVLLKTDLSGTALRRSLGDFELTARGADIAIVYFAGHGIEAGGRNYLVPTDARLERDVDIEDEAVPLDRVLKAVAGASQLKLVILDACRNDPFKASMQRLGAVRSVDRGLARIEPESRTLVAYSAAAGTVAQDGEPGGHSPFAEALLKDLAVPNLDIRLALGRVHDDVVDATHGQQEPFTYGSLGGGRSSLGEVREVATIVVVMVQPSSTYRTNP